MDKPVNSNTRLGIAGWIALAAMVTFLGVAIVYAAHAWNTMSGISMSGAGWFFMICGIVFTVGLGGGLMALVFYSSRKGLDR